MKGLAINCTLKPSPAESSCELLLSELLAQMREHGVAAHLARVLKQQPYPSG